MLGFEFLLSSRGPVAHISHLRADVAVSLYIVLSGFVTHLAYSAKTFSTPSAVGNFYLRRFGRIWLTYYFSCALGLTQRALMGQLSPASEYLLPMLLLDAWHPTAREPPPGQTRAWLRYLPVNDGLARPSHLPRLRITGLDAVNPNLNPAGWTLSTLTLAWVAYPALNAGFRRVPSRPAFLVGLTLLLSAIAVAPALGLFAARTARGAAPGEAITRAESLYLYQFPPARLCEFMLGMASRQLVQVEGLLAWPHWQWVGWTAAAAIALSSAAVPSEHLGRVDQASTACTLATRTRARYHHPHLSRIFGHLRPSGPQEAVFISVCSPAWALVLIAISADANRSSLVRALRHPVISSIGGYSFAVYLFQWLWYYAWEEAESSNMPGIAPGINAAYLPGLLITLWLSAALWTELVEAPFAAGLKELLTAETKLPPSAEGKDTAKGAAAIEPPVVPARSRLLIRTVLRVGLALAVGVSSLLLMHWTPSPKDISASTTTNATNATNATGVDPWEWYAIPPQSATTVSSSVFARSNASFQLPCGRAGCSAALNASALGHTCGDRIRWLRSAAGGAHSELSACHKVAVIEYPLACGDCAPENSGMELQRTGPLALQPDDELRPVGESESEHARRPAAEIENTCTWTAEESPQAAARGRGKFIGMSLASKFFSLTGRWVDEKAGGVLTDWLPGAAVGFQVAGTDNLFVAAHRRCATRGLSGRGAVFCCDWMDFFQHGTPLHCGAPGLLVDVLVNAVYAGTFDGSPRCGLEQLTTTPDHHALHHISGLDPNVTSIIHLVVRSDAKRGGLTVRGLVLPDGGHILPLPDLPAPRGRLVVLGGSRALGQGVLADEDGHCSLDKYDATSHPAYGWPSVLAHKLRLEYSGVGLGKFHCREMLESETIGHFDPDFPMVNSSTAPRTHAWYRHSLANIAIDHSTLNFTALEAETPTLIVLFDLEMFGTDACEETFASLLMVLHELHPRALLAMSRGFLEFAAFNSLCDATLRPKHAATKSLCDSIVALDYDGLQERLYERKACNEHPNSLSQNRAAHFILEQLRNQPRFLREPLLAADVISSTDSLLARDHSPVLTGDPLGRWRYLPRSGMVGAASTLCGSGSPLKADADGYLPSPAKL